MHSAVLVLSENRNHRGNNATHTQFHHVTSACTCTSACTLKPCSLTHAAYISAVSFCNYMHRCLAQHGTTWSPHTYNLQKILCTLITLSSELCTLLLRPVSSLSPELTFLSLPASVILTPLVCSVCAGSCSAETHTAGQYLYYIETLAHLEMITFFKK